MNTDLIGLIFEKSKVPNAMKTGMIASFIVFKLFDIEGQVKRRLWPKQV